MANIVASDILARVRSLATEKDPQGRWSDDEIRMHANDACVDVALRTDWVQGSITTTTQNGIQEYTLPGLIAILRVYLAGQLIPATSIDDLEGVAEQVYDQWGSTLTPQWRQISGSFVYPIQNDQAAPVDSIQFYGGPSSGTFRPKVYLRDGNLGFVFPPATGQTLQLDIIAEPIVMVDNETETAFSRVFMDPIVYNTLARMYYADENDAKGNIYDAKYENALLKVIQWRRNLMRNLPRKLTLYPYRIVTYSQPGYRG
jgi:hypothetical protein